MGKKSITQALAGALLAVSMASMAADLTIAVATEPTSLDPHFQALNSNHELSMHVYDTLSKVDAHMQIAPALATKWHAVDAKTWEFKLRQGVKFHDGSPFTAKDVVFSIPTGTQGTQCTVNLPPARLPCSGGRGS